MTSLAKSRIFSGSPVT
ncbi:hypothetical protein D049_0029A, partial [Vibrio parahaemolyticus VPTS-2010]